MTKEAKKQSEFMSHADRCDFMSRLALLQVEAGRLGLFKTMQVLHEASRVAGFELADLMLAARKVKP